MITGGRRFKIPETSHLLFKKFRHYFFWYVEETSSDGCYGERVFGVMSVRNEGMRREEVNNDDGLVEK
jgi:hypothetical protein